MSTNPKTIKGYDSFAQRFQQELVTGFHHPYIEKPAIRKMLGAVQGKKILCIGSGTGEEVDFLANQGAQVIGIDLSDGMLAQAKKTYPSLDFRKMDMNNLEFPPSTFDFAYSSLAVHYSSNINKLFKSINKVLNPGGMFVFSSTHPVFEIVGEELIGDWKYQIIGQAKNIKSKDRKYFGDYFTEGEVEQYWWEEQFPVVFYHWTIESIIKSLIGSGFEIVDYAEPKPLPESKELFPKKYEKYTHRPGFMIFKCSKK